MNTPKRLISAAIALTLAIVPSLGCASESISGLQLSAAAAEVNQPSEVSAVWNGSEDTSWYNDNDTTFTIRTAEQLAGLSKLVREGNSMEEKLITLESDIVLNDTSNFSNWDTQPPKNNWIPIGIAPKGSNGKLFDAGGNCFSGAFNGNGHKIIGMYSFHDNYAGLFAKVKYGGIFKTIVKDSYVKAESPQDKPWDTLAAGIAVDCVSSVVSECEFDGIVIASGLTNNLNGSHCTCAGGIVASCGPNSDTGVFMFLTMGMGFLINPLLVINSDQGSISSPGIYNCINRGTIYSENHKAGYIASGGILGYGNGQGGGIIQNSINLGRVSVLDETAGGIIGRTLNYNTTNCYYTNAEKDNGSLEAGGSAKDTAVNFTKANISKPELVKKLGSAFIYQSGEIYLACSAEQEPTYNPAKLPTDSDPIYGDLDGDGTITSSDALLILRQSVNLENFTPVLKKLADVDGDGMITSADSLEVLRYSVGLPTKGNIGKYFE